MHLKDYGLTTLETRSDNGYEFYHLWTQWPVLLFLKSRITDIKLLKKIKKCYKLHSIHYYPEVFKWLYDNFLNVVDVGPT